MVSRRGDDGRNGSQSLLQQSSVATTEMDKEHGDGGLESLDPLLLVSLTSLTCSQLAMVRSRINEACSTLSLSKYNF